MSIPGFLFGLYLVNSVSFLMMLFDKWAAVQGLWRIREGVLLVCNKTKQLCDDLILLA